MSEVRRYSDLGSLSEAFAEFFTNVATEAVHNYGRFSVALAGGSTPIRLYELLAASYSQAVPWRKTHLFWGDERTVPPDHDDSNYRTAYETLVKHVGIPDDNVYRVHGELNPVDAAARYQQTLEDFFGAGTLPVFDLVLLGIGDDGHTASLFPHTPALQETSRWVVANQVPQENTTRITLTVPVINASRTICFLVAGERKADILREVINGPYRPETYPAQLIEPKNGSLIWFVDEAAAALL
ncbi:MAG: 6-phosphogluconolactonase [Chloroflexota bacterium]